MTKDLNEEATAGRGVVINCNIGFGVGIEETLDGRANIHVRKSIVESGRNDAIALRSFMEETAVEWLKQVAPHRLALGANDR